MGAKAHVQVVHPKYGVSEVPLCAREAFASFLAENGIEVMTDDGCQAQYSDHWDIVIPYDENAKKRLCGKITSLVSKLRRNPDCLDSLMEEHHRGHRIADNCSDLLSEGVRVAKAEGYETIAVDWF